MPLNVMSPKPAISGAARDLYEAHRSGVPCKPIRSLLVDGDVDGAYSVQEQNTCRWIDEGRRLVGRKIGLTSKAVQQAAGIDQPDYGMLFADMSVLNGDVIPKSRLTQPRAEGEVAFVMQHDLDQPDAVMPEVLDAVAYALPALEIVDSRIENFDARLVDTIADNASSGLIVLGTRPVKLSDIDLTLCGMMIERNGDAVAFGAGMACLGNPLHGLLWLARKMASVGRPLAAGDIVLSGALGPMVTMTPGDFIETRISQLGSVSIRYGVEG
jgi:2-keto-4-pentenoate hydratase